MSPLPFSSFFLGGFECSSHRHHTGRRIDVIDASRHDLYATQDYARLREMGLLAARDGLRWPLIESGGQFEFSSAQKQVEAARKAAVTVVWDLLHYGYPDGLDPFSPEFPERFAQFARAATEFLRDHTPGTFWLCPVNEISFMAWGGGSVGYLNPFNHGRGDELKANLVRASIAAMHAARSVNPAVKFLHAEPLIHIRPHPDTPEAQTEAQRHHDAQFSALDWLTGRERPELGGQPDFVDLLGLNIYPYNQWFHHAQEGQKVIGMDDPDFVPLREQFQAVYERYGLPLLVAETGAEEGLRGPWLEMVTREALAARAAGVPLGGICLYPVVNHPGWDDDRHCRNGLWDYPDVAGERALEKEYAAALVSSQRLVNEQLVREAGLLAQPEPLPLSAALARLRRAAPVIASEAAERDRDVQFPAASFVALREAGVMTLTLPPELGGGGIGGTGLLHLLRAVGRLSLPVGRIFEGHVNALGLIVRYGTPEQARQAAADAAVGELFGVWNTEEGEGLRLEGNTLRGNKTFTSGAWHVTRPLCPAEGAAGRQMVLLRDVLPERFDPAFWQPAGMRSSVSYRADLSGLHVTPEMQIGPPSAYYAQPEFSGGALRFLAVQLGGADAAIASVRVGLRRAGRAGDDVQRLRFAGAAAGLEAAWRVVLEGEKRLEQVRLGRGTAQEVAQEAALAYVSLARLLTEDACLNAAEACERAAGARGLLPPFPTERLLRDLRLYLRQPAPDAARLSVGAFVLDAPEDEDDVWSWPDV